jgi:hypothetical protein
VRGREGGGFSPVGSCGGAEEGSGDASWEGGWGGGGGGGGADVASASPSRRGELGGGVSEDCRGTGDVFCAALPGEKGADMLAEGTEGELSFWRARGSESLEAEEMVFHAKWSLF